jgi:hypothetical protein
VLSVAINFISTGYPMERLGGLSDAHRTRGSGARRHQRQHDHADWRVDAVPTTS